MDSNLPLDQPLIEHDNANPLDYLAERWQRFVNLIVDIIGYYLLAFIFGIIYLLTFKNPEIISKGMSYLVAFLAFFIYYFFFENFFGKTLGKLVTRTHVVTEEGSTPSSLEILARTFCRIIPFEAFSFLFKKPVGWHDSLSGTMVIKDKKSQKL